MTRPRLLDLFCGAGGAAAGYHRAGFDVVGIDNRPQPNYPFAFYERDALDVLRQMRDAYLGTFDAIHASPPCQHYAGVTAWRGNRDDHPDLIGPTRALLEQTGLPYVIENVQDARRELINPVRLCGSQFLLPVRRHRYFETNWPMPFLAHPCGHRRDDLAFEHKSERAYADAMGCEWMTSREAREAVPPAFTEFVGAALMAHLLSGVAA